MQTGIALVREIIIDRQRIGNADAREGQTLLALQERDLFRLAQCQRMRTALRETGGEQRGHLIRRHRSIGYATSLAPSAIAVESRGTNTRVRVPIAAALMRRSARATAAHQNVVG